MDAITNDQISNRNPSEYISEFEQSNPDFSDLLETHYISLNGFGIKTDDYMSFVNSRSKALYNKLCKLIIPNKSDTIDESVATIL